MTTRARTLSPTDCSRQLSLEPEQLGRPPLPTASGLSPLRQSHPTRSAGARHIRPSDPPKRADVLRLRFLLIAQNLVIWLGLIPASGSNLVQLSRRSPPWTQEQHHRDLLNPSRRAGRKSTARRNANNASTVMPTSRNGSEISQIRGNNTNASTAKGQQSTNRRHHAITRSSILIRPKAT